MYLLWKIETETGKSNMEDAANRLGKRKVLKVKVITKIKLLQTGNKFTMLKKINI